MAKITTTNTNPVNHRQVGLTKPSERELHYVDDDDDVVVTNDELFHVKSVSGIAFSSSTT